MTLSVTHTKVNNIPDPTQADVNAQIALGNLPPGTVLADLTLHSDWNAAHTLTAAGLSALGRSANSAGAVADIVAASNGGVLRRNGTSIGFGTLDLSNSTGTFTGVLGSGNGGIGTLTDLTVCFVRGGSINGENSGTNQFIYQSTAHVLSLGIGHAFAIGTVYDSGALTYSRGTIFSDGAVVTPGVSTLDLDMTLYVTGAKALDDTSGSFGGAGFIWTSGDGGNNSLGDDSVPSQAGTMQWMLGHSGNATGVNTGNGADGPGYVFVLGTGGASDNADPGNTSYFLIKSHLGATCFYIDDGYAGAGTPQCIIYANILSTGNLHLTQELIANTSQSNNDCLFYGVTDTHLLHVHAATDRVSIGVASPTAWFEIKQGNTTNAPLKLTSGNLATAGAVLAGNIEFLNDEYFLTISTGPSQKRVALCDSLLTSGFIPAITTGGRLTNSTLRTPTNGRFTAQTAAKASVVTLTAGAADGSFLISGNVNVTTSTAFSFTMTCAYTDETNTSRTLTMTFSNLAGTLLTTITNVLGAGPYEAIAQQIRAKASTAITLATVGTFTTVTYNVEGSIFQTA